MKREGYQLCPYCTVYSGRIASVTQGRDYSKRDSSLAAGLRTAARVSTLSRRRTLRTES